MRFVGWKWIGFIPAILLIGLSVKAQAAEEEKTFWAHWKTPGVHAIMRHATAPGYGDPDNFELHNCATQRNLSAQGREEARVTGAAFKAQQTLPTAVYSSQWCRTTETAKLLDLAQVNALQSLNSFFQGRGDEGKQTRALKDFLLKQSPDAKLFLVTHQVNITGLTGSFAQSGEVLLFRMDGDQAIVLARNRF